MAKPKDDVAQAIRKTAEDAGWHVAQPNNRLTLLYHPKTDEAAAVVRRIRHKPTQNQLETINLLKSLRVNVRIVRLNGQTLNDTDTVNVIRKAVRPRLQPKPGR